MLRIFADTIIVIVAHDPIRRIVLIDDIAYPVVQKGDPLLPILEIQRRLKIFQFFRMHRSGNRKRRKPA